MTLISRRKFELEDMPEASRASNVQVVRCEFRSCTFGSATTSTLAEVNGLRVEKSVFRHSVAHAAAFSDLLLSDVEMTRGNMIYSCTFRRAKVLGKLKGLFLVAVNEQMTRSPELLRSIRGQYANQNELAIDLRDATQTIEITLRSVPGRLVGLRPGVDARMNLSQAERILANAIELDRRFPDLILGILAADLVHIGWIETLAVVAEQKPAMKAAYEAQLATAIAEGLLEPVEG